MLAPYRWRRGWPTCSTCRWRRRRSAGLVESAGERRPGPCVRADVLPGAPGDLPGADSLTVDGTDVPWRYAGGELHAATVEGLAHGLAWAAGRWPARHLLAALLLSPDETARLLAEADLDLA